MPSALRSLHPAVASRVARMALARLGAGRYIGFDHVERRSGTWRGCRTASAREPAGSAGDGGSASGSCSGGACAAPASRTLFGFRCLFLVRSCSSRRAGRFRPSSGRRRLRHGRVTRAGRERGPSVGESRPEPWRLPLSVRSRQPGDRFRPAGMQRAPEEAAGLLRRPQNRREERDAVPLVVDRRRPDCVGRRARRGRGFSGHGAFARRDTLESKAVRRPRLNSTLKSLLFWMVLVVVGVLIWNFSTAFAVRGRPAFRSRSSSRRSTTGEVQTRRHHRQRDHRQATNGNAGDGTDKFRTYAPSAVRRPRQQAR